MITGCRSTKSILGMRAWQKRFFVLNTRAFLYYQTKKDFKEGKQPLDSIAFDRCVICAAQTQRLSAPNYLYNC